MRPVLVLALALVLEATVHAQAPRENGDKLRADLAKAPPRELGTQRLSVHLGRARVGDLTLGTTVEDKGGEKLYHLHDELRIEAPGFGAIYLELDAYLATDLSVRDLALNVTKPNAKGATERRRLAVAPEDGALHLTETLDEAAPTKRKLEGVDVRALVLTPPLGVGERLARLAPGDVGSRLSFEGWDLARGEKTTLALSFDEVADVDVRGAATRAQKVTRTEGTARLEEWLAAPGRELVRLDRADGPARLVFVGREGETLDDLPAPERTPGESPAETVLRFLRATGRGDRKEVEELLDLDALAARAKVTDEKLAKTYRKTVVDLLTGPEWRRGEGVRLVAGAARAEDLETTVHGDRASVTAKGASSGFELARTAAGWRIVGLPEGQ